MAHVEMVINANIYGCDGLQKYGYRRGHRFHCRRYNGHYRCMGYVGMRAVINEACNEYGVRLLLPYLRYVSSSLAV